MAVWWARCPCYAKSHSRGEYVFDHGWAEAFERAGGQYYPKLQVSVPFTPATGRRLLVRKGPDAEAVRSALADALIDVCQRSDASSAHVTFLTEPEWQLLGNRGFLKRTHQQFHWENAGYGTFDDFLAALSSRKRKTIRREREDALAQRYHRSLADRHLTSRKACGTRSSTSTWKPVRANGVGPISRANSTRWSARRWATAFCW